MDDLISRQAAIRWVKTECNPYGKPTLDFESGKKVIEHLKQMPSAQQWIPCSERMPNPNELNGNVIKYYLVQNVFGDMLVCYWDGKEWGLIYSYETEVPEDVVAWMPLPEPYKGEGNEAD